ncbi:serine hydrolase domain-containing protein [Poriferisphaera sp. WC338]|uniref:serine hydrolase domain-containing protein n=1 Tax=Poriferisphaera sp. WC338 TaxID=3425129 RepID=UPI003D81AFCE
MSVQSPEIILPQIKTVLEEGANAGRDPSDASRGGGAQIFASIHDEPVIDFAIGDAQPGTSMTRDTLNLWLSASKPITAVCFAQQFEKHEVDLDTPVCEYLPDFAAHGKDAITLKHVLTHTGGFRVVPYRYPKDSVDDVVAKICKSRPEPRWKFGKTAGYHLHTGWYILAAVVQKLSGQDYSHYVREHLFKPLGMDHCYVGMPSETYDTLKDNIAIMPNFDDGGSKGGLGDTAAEKAWVCGCRPGGNGYGPVRELARFYEMMLGGGERDGIRIIEPETVGLFTHRHREGAFDKTFGQTIDWGLGFLLDSKRHGEVDLHYGYGPHASDDTFGHSGYQSSAAFADPHHGLAFAVVFNSTPGENENRQRMFQLLKTVYEELGLA